MIDLYAIVGAVGAFHAACFCSAPAFAQVRPVDSDGVVTVDEAPTDDNRWRFATLVGGFVGTSVERFRCEPRGDLDCSGVQQGESGLGWEGAPIFELLYMSPTHHSARVGGGMRFAPAGWLNVGPELHFAIVPELVVPVVLPNLSFSLRMFGGFVVSFPREEIGKQQDQIAKVCQQASSQGLGTCSTSSLSTGIAVDVGVGLIHAVEPIRVRYLIGVQGIMGQATAVGQLFTGEDYEKSENARYTKYETDATRMTLLVGIEW